MDAVLKWAGSKRQLLGAINTIITPNTLKGQTLYEPFVGGGSVFLSYEHDNVVINDSNPELINVYFVIKKHHKELLELLQEHKANHCHDYYYKIRSLDRQECYKNMSDIEKASRIIYLNRTCFNGLYRVNSKGYFNVPIGRYVNPDIVQQNKIEKLSNYLNNSNIQILCGDFENAVLNARPNDVIYFDPPYDYENVGFTSYTANSFNRDDLIRLKQVCDNLISKGCKVVISNNNTTYVNDLFSDTNYNKTIVLAKRMINCNGERRNDVEEVLIYG